MTPISNEKREMIIEAKKRGESEKSIMMWVKDVSRSSVTKIWSLYNKTGSYLPKPYIGSKSKINAETDKLIRTTIKNKPDITLLEIIYELSLPITESGLGYKLKRTGLTYKKRLSILMDKNARM